jgi:hypothetical protein
MQKAYKNKLFTLQHTPFDMKKNFVFQQIFLLKYDSEDFLKRNVHVISIQLNKHNVDYLKLYGWHGTKLKRLTFTRKTHFQALRNTEYLCRLLPN